jgi:hypothetical protein
MDELSLDERCNRFWEECDGWVDDRLDQLSRAGVELTEDDAAAIDGRVEEDMTALLEECLERYGDSFNPRALADLHHLFFELELKKRGVDNGHSLHRYKDNGMLGLSVVQGKVTPDNALLLMEVNRAHRAKKDGNEDAVCEDCVCGRKEDG